MSDRNRRGRASLLLATLLGLCGVCSVCALPAVANAAALTPESLTNCSGSIAPDGGGAAAGEPYLLDYTFQCDTDISAYTVIVNRQAGDDGNLDDFNSSPLVLDSDGLTPNGSESVTCEGSTPSDGINCNLGAGVVLSAGNFAEGSVDLVAPYCKYLPSDAAPGTPAVPQANVQLVVTDNTGAQDGPFDLSLAKSCPNVANFVPTPKPKKKKPKSTGKGKAKSTFKTKSKRRS